MGKALATALRVSPLDHANVRKTCKLDGRKFRSEFRYCTRPEQAISCFSPVQVHGPHREWKRKAAHEMLVGPLCTIKPGTLRPACTGQQPGAGHRWRLLVPRFVPFWLYVALRRPQWQHRLLVRCRTDGGMKRLTASLWRQRIKEDTKDDKKHCPALLAGLWVARPSRSIRKEKDTDTAKNTTCRYPLPPSLPTALTTIDEPAEP